MIEAYINSPLTQFDRSVRRIFDFFSMLFAPVLFALADDQEEERKELEERQERERADEEARLEAEAEDAREDKEEARQREQTAEDERDRLGNPGQ